MPSLRPAFAAFSLVLVASPALAAGDPAAPIAAFDDALLAAMKAGRTASLKERAARLLPAVRATHDLPRMAALVVGPAWAGTAAGDRAALIEAFARHSALSYAANFKSYGGERFVVDPAVVARGPDRVVKASIVGSGAPTILSYRMRDAGDGWRIVDIYADGVSQVAVQRSEFAATVARDGVAGLARRLDAADAARLGK